MQITRLIREQSVEKKKTGKKKKENPLGTWVKPNCTVRNAIKP